MIFSIIIPNLMRKTIFAILNQLKNINFQNSEEIIVVNEVQHNTKNL